MVFSHKDKSNFLKGLLVLIRKDNFIHKNERELMLEFGESLGFEKELYKPVVDSFLTKEKIDDSPPIFSDNKITLQFFEAAIRMAFVDDYFHVKELVWLKKVAKKNNISPDDLTKKIDVYLELYPEKKSSI